MSAPVPFHMAVALALAVASSHPATAQDLSPWQQDKQSAVRLLAGSRTGAALLGGVAIHLAPGWKTYWRTPGDSGVPPRFDFSRSENVESVTVLWPAPLAFDDGAGGLSLGYKNDVVLPLRITAKATDRPVMLRMSINYGVCEKLCLPVEAELELAFSSVASSQDAVLREAIASVPKPAKIGDGGALAIGEVKREGAKVIVDVVASDASAVSLFVEGPSPDWALPVPKPQVVTHSGRRRFDFLLEGLPPGAPAEGNTLTFTLVGPNEAYEINAKLN